MRQKKKGNRIFIRPLVKRHPRNRCNTGTWCHHEDRLVSAFGHFTTTGDERVGGDMVKARAGSLPYIAHQVRGTHTTVPSPYL